jgi:hypothetical protein
MKTKTTKRTKTTRALVMASAVALKPVNVSELLEQGSKSREFGRRVEPLISALHETMKNGVEKPTQESVAALRKHAAVVAQVADELEALL